MSDISILPMGPHEYAVTLTEGDLTTNHRVTVPEQLLDDLAMPDLDEQALVHESFAFLLEQEKATQIRRDFALDEISNYFPDYLPTIRDRLSA